MFARCRPVILSKCFVLSAAKHISMFQVQLPAWKAMKKNKIPNLMNNLPFSAMWCILYMWVTYCLA